MLKLRNLLAEREQLEAEIRTTYLAERRNILAKIRRVMRYYGITSAELDDIRDRRLGPRSKAKDLLDFATAERLISQGRPPSPPVDTNRDQLRTVSHTPLHEQPAQNPVCTVSFPELTESEWQCIAPLLPELRRPPTAGRPPADARAVFNGVLWVLYSHAAWNAMPPQYPTHATCHRRFKIWENSGALQRVVDALPEPRGSELHELIASRVTRRTSHAMALGLQAPRGSAQSRGTSNVRFMR